MQLHYLPTNFSQENYKRKLNDMNCTGEVSLQQHENVSLKQFRHIKSCD